MIFDVSEVKQYLACKRQWYFNSRNAMCLDGKTSPALQFGSEYHAGLADLYRGVPFSELPDSDANWLIEMYANEIYPLDMEMFDILDVEWYFKVNSRELFGHLAPNCVFAGCIDLIVRHKESGEIWGIEHKTASKPRKASDMQGDLQCLTYYRMLELRYREHVGGIILSEVLKNKKTFKHQRMFLRYSERDVTNYRQQMIDILNRMVADTAWVNTEHAEGLTGEIPSIHNAEMLACKWCAFAEVCREVQLTVSNTLTVDIWHKVRDLYKHRIQDHLEVQK